MFVSKPAWFTFLLADAFVFDNVLVVESLQDVDLSGEVVALLLPVLRFQRLYCDHFPCPVPARIVETQLHFPKMSLRRKCIYLQSRFQTCSLMQRSSLNVTFCYFNRRALVYLSQFSELLQEPSFKHSWVLWCFVWGVDRKS